MLCWLVISLCLPQLISLSELPMEAPDIYSIEKDVKNFNLTCKKDSCTYGKRDSLSSRSCHCGIQCVQLGTCCFDSPYADIPQPKVKPSCRSVNKDESYYMVDQCSSNDSVLASQCNDEWKEGDDVEKLVAITSLKTFITYKNYYCFKCHENTDEFLRWDVKAESDSDLQKTSESVAKQSDRPISLTYKKDMNTWMVMNDENTGSFPVHLSLQIPSKIEKLIHVCEPNVISDCSKKWTDEDVRSKCQSYMALKEVKRNNVSLKYRNVHCAQCNFEKLNDMHCWSLKVNTFAQLPFSCLVDVNPATGNTVCRQQRCSGNEQWDPFFNRCREVRCFPGRVMRNGQCVPM